MPLTTEELRAIRKARRDRCECVQCGRPAQGYATCQRCRQMRAERNKNMGKNVRDRRNIWRKRYYRYQLAHKMRRAETRRQRIAAGLCCRCGIAKVEKYRDCLECRKYLTAGYARRRAAKTAR